MTIEAPDGRTMFRNLLGGTLARRWIEDAAARLRKALPELAAAGAVAQDGGLIVEDIGALVPEELWRKVSRELFLA
jgi:hypothetical protein